MTATSDKLKTPTILVVDDMQICREPISEILRSRGFEALCAADGHEALRLLGERDVDLVLLDLKMPGMDGLSVLKAIRSRHELRDLPVFLLTDLADRQTVQTAVSLGIQGYLLKSEFSSEGLLDRVGRFLAPRSSGGVPRTRNSRQPAAETPSGDAPPTGDEPVSNPQACRQDRFVESTRPLSKEDVLEAVGRSLELRPVPAVLHQVVSLTNSSHASIHEVVDTIRQDQALALRVMKVANSSFYATGTPAHNLLEAAGRLGMFGIRNAVLTVVTIDHFARAEETGLIPQRFWEHSLGAAAIAKSLAEAMLREDGEEIFLAALLHDVGRLVLAAAFPEEYKRILETSRSDNTPLDSAERDAFNIGHAEITREVLRRLNLAAPVVNTASLHGRDAREIRAVEQDPHPATIVALSNRLAHALVLGDSGDSTLLPLEEFAEGLSIAPAVIGKLGREAANMVGDMELFYACHGEQEFLPPLATELASVVKTPPRVVVLAPNAPDDGLSLFFEQLRWLHDESPNVAVLYGWTDTDFDSQLAQLERIERRIGRQLSVLQVTVKAGDSVQEPSWGERPHRAVHMPIRYVDLVRSVVEFSQEI